MEGEFDALSMAQEDGDIVAAVATGSTQGARHPRWIQLLETSAAVLVAYDSDEAGEQAAGWGACLVPGDWYPRAILQGCSKAAKICGDG